MFLCDCSPFPLCQYCNSPLFSVSESLSLSPSLCTGCAAPTPVCLSLLLPLISWSLNLLWEGKWEEMWNNPVLVLILCSFHWDQRDTAEQRGWAAERGRRKPLFSSRDVRLSYGDKGLTAVLRDSLPHSLLRTIICTERQTPFLSIFPLLFQSIFYTTLFCGSF